MTFTPFTPFTACTRCGEYSHNTDDCQTLTYTAWELHDNDTDAVGEESGTVVFAYNVEEAAQKYCQLSDEHSEYEFACAGCGTVLIRDEQGNTTRLFVEVEHIPTYSAVALLD